MAFVKYTFLDFCGTANAGSQRRTRSEGPVGEAPVCWVPGRLSETPEASKVTIAGRSEQSECGVQKDTTMMLRNIPVGLSHDQVHVSLLSLQICFDVLHVPADPKSGCNRGYAFLNCVSAEAYAEAALALSQTQLPGYVGSKKVLEVCPAKVQGKAALRHLARGRQATGRKSR